MTTLLAVDPSLSCTGYAWFQDGVLRDCGVNPTAPDMEFRSRLIVAGYKMQCAYSKLIIEWPQIYRGRGKGEDPNALLDVAAVVGAIITRVSAGEVRRVRPAEWKGQVPKEIHNARVLKRLAPAELAVLKALGLPKSKIHNAIDAIGLGLFDLGRMARPAPTGEA